MVNMKVNKEDYNYFSILSCPKFTVLGLETGILYGIYIIYGPYNIQVKIRIEFLIILLTQPRRVVSLEALNEDFSHNVAFLKYCQSVNRCLNISFGLK